MKRFLLLCLPVSLLIQPLESLAQPTLTATGINPTLGMTLTYYSVQSQYSPGNSGANQTWNLSTMSGTSLGLTTIVTASSTTYGSQFSNANIAYSTPGSGVSYIKTSSTAQQNYGMAPESGAAVLSYYNPEDLLRFPFTYNDTYSDTWGVTFVSGTTFYRTGTTTVTADGYGTLITPTGTYTNVLRVHFYQSYRDSAYMGMPYIINYTNDEYIWYKDGYRTPLAGVYHTTNSISGDGYGASYPSLGSGVDETAGILSSLSVFPNPASDMLNITLETENSGQIAITMSDVTGRLTQVSAIADAVQGVNNIVLDVSSLSPGIYYMTLTFDGEKVTCRQISVVE